MLVRRDWMGAGKGVAVAGGRMVVVVFGEGGAFSLFCEEEALGG